LRQPANAFSLNYAKTDKLKSAFAAQSVPDRVRCACVACCNILIVTSWFTENEVHPSQSLYLWYPTTPVTHKHVLKDAFFKAS